MCTAKQVFNYSDLTRACYYIYCIQFFVKVFIIFSISFALLVISTSKKSFHYNKRSSVELKKFPGKNIMLQKFYNATQIGVKRGLDPKLKSSFQRFGLLHLMTPSGIHLSSLLLFVFLFLKSKYKIFIYLSIGIILYSLAGFYSLKRIVYFHLINYFLKDSRLSFSLTFLLDLLLGGYALSPLSFSYSFLCWGVIVFSPNKLQVFLNLFFSQLFIAYFSQDLLNPLSIIINPFFTTIFSTSFPILSLNYWLINIGFINDLIFNYLDLFIKSIQFLDKHLYFFNFIPSALCLFIPFIKTKKQILCFLVFATSSLNPIPSAKNSSQKILIGLSYKEELISTKEDKSVFVDRSCKRSFRGHYWEIKCKKKAHRFGGLRF